MPGCPNTRSVTENATLDQRIEILDWHHINGSNQTKTAKHFAPKYPNLRLKQPKIADWVKNKSRYRQQHAESVSKKVKRMRQTQHPEVTEMLELWVEQAMRDKIHVSGEVLRQKWTEFAVLCGIPEEDRLALSEGWLGRLKVRLGLHEFKRHGEAASASPEVVEEERKRVRELIEKGGFKARDIYNMDETGLFYGCACFWCLPGLLTSVTGSLQIVGCQRRLIVALKATKSGLPTRSRSMQMAPPSSRPLSSARPSSPVHSNATLRAPSASCIGTMQRPG
jgi:hypothetical protein